MQPSRGSVVRFSSKEERCSSKWLCYSFAKGAFEVEKDLLLNSPFLFPKDRVEEVVEERKAKQESSFMGNVAKLAHNAQKASYHRPTSSSSSQQMRKRKITLMLKQAKGPAATSSATPPPQAKRGKLTFRGQGAPRRGKSKGRGREVNEGGVPPTPPPQVGDAC